MKLFILTLAILAIASLYIGASRPVFAGSTSTGTTASSSGPSTSTGNAKTPTTVKPGGGPQVKPMPPIQLNQAIKPRVPTQPRP